MLCRSLKQLHERCTRVKFCPPDCWIASTPSRIPPELFLEVESKYSLCSYQSLIPLQCIHVDESEIPLIAHTIMREAELLKKAPFLFSFTDRVVVSNIILVECMQSSILG